MSNEVRSYYDTVITLIFMCNRRLYVIFYIKFSSFYNLVKLRLFKFYFESKCAPFHLVSLINQVDFQEKFSSLYKLCISRPITFK